MTQPPCPVGYGRPPQHTRFRKGQSGNPGGRPGPKRRLKLDFDAALSAALNGDVETLRQAKPARVVEAFARQVVLDALDGRVSAQRLVISFLDAEDSDASLEESRGEPAARISEEERHRRLLGGRYEEFNRRFDAAVAAGSVDDLLALAKEFDGALNSLSEGNSQGNFEKDPNGAAMRTMPDKNVETVEEAIVQVVEPPASDAPAAEPNGGADSLSQGISEGILKKDQVGEAMRISSGARAYSPRPLPGALHFVGARELYGAPLGQDGDTALIRESECTDKFPFSGNFSGNF